MKYEITHEDTVQMAYDLTHDRTLKHLKNLSFYKFTIGDVLIREDKYRKAGVHDAFEWKTKTADCGIPNKYVYVFENELGIGYIRRLSVNGRKFVDRSVCVTEFDPDQTRFILDPEYADHMLLSGENTEFDTKTRYDEIKKKREKLNRKNRKLRLSMNSNGEFINWLQTLKIGDKVWFGYNIADIVKEPYYVNKIVISSVSIADTPHMKLSLTPPTSPVVVYGPTVHSYNFRSNFISTQKPFFLDEIID